MLRAAAYLSNAAGLWQNEINSCMAVGQGSVAFDLRKPPREYEPQEYDHHSRYSVFLQPKNRLRLVCKNFPWTIEIKDEWVYCSLVWDVMYEALQKPIKSSEWALIAHDESKRQEINKARRKRLERYREDDLRPKRIDWLGEMTLFRGLYCDEAFVRNVLLPGKDEWMETCVIRLDSHWPRS
ncbi:hypothetical protein BC835DRAFT_1292396 [Cytidiella melzeri]|nr:hypothetical protein BC835DRAFT_1292396 [Cytidiella melzeri]